MKPRSAPTGETGGIPNCVTEYLVRTMSAKHGLYLQNSPAYLEELATPTALVRYAEAAEEAGWDGVFLADGLTPAFPSADPWITLAGIAARTSDVRLGTWVSPLPRRPPWQVAQDLATLDHLSDGRVILGAGLGNKENYTTYGREWAPGRLGEQYDEALDVISGLWAGGPFSYDGEHFTVEEAELHLTPVQDPRIPIVMGCWWPNKKPFHRAANWDGIMPWAPSFSGGEGLQGEPVTGTPEAEVRDLVAYYREIADDPGEIILPVDPPEAPPDFADVCREVGASWLLTTELLAAKSHEQNLERIREGPSV